MDHKTDARMDRRVWWVAGWGTDESGRPLTCDASGGKAASKVNILGGTWLEPTLFWEALLGVWLVEGSMMVICFFLGSTLRKELDSTRLDWDAGHTRTITFTWGPPKKKYHKVLILEKYAVDTLTCHIIRYPCTIQWTTHSHLYRDQPRCMSISIAMRL